MKDLIPLPKRLLQFRIIISLNRRSLQLHIRICYFGNGAHDEDTRKQENKDGDGEVDPLYAFKGIHAVRGIREEDVGAEDGTDDGAYCVEALGDVDADFSEVGWAADCTFHSYMLAL